MDTTFCLMASRAQHSPWWTHRYHILVHRYPVLDREQRFHIRIHFFVDSLTLFPHKILAIVYQSYGSLALVFPCYGYNFGDDRYKGTPLLCLNRSTDRTLYNVYSTLKKKCKIRKCSDINSSHLWLGKFYLSFVNYECSLISPWVVTPPSFLARVINLICKSTLFFDDCMNPTLIFA